VSYAAKYRITPGLKGYWVWEAWPDGKWDQLGIPFDTWEKAEEAIRRVASKEVRHYSESGEAV
jgi:hypothetical protein